MTYYLFDNPRMALLIAASLEGILLIGWLINREKVRTCWLLAGPLAAALALGLDWLVETNREQLDRRTRLVIKAVEERQTDVVIEALHPDFLLPNGMNKDQAAKVIRVYLSKPFIDSDIIRHLEVTDSSDQAGQVMSSVFTMMDKDSPYAYVGAVTSQWRFHFGRDNRQEPYRLTSIENLGINGSESRVDVWHVR